MAVECGFMLSLSFWQFLLGRRVGNHGNQPTFSAVDASIVALLVMHRASTERTEWRLAHSCCLVRQRPCRADGRSGKPRSCHSCAQRPEKPFFRAERAVQKTLSTEIFEGWRLKFWAEMLKIIATSVALPAFSSIAAIASVAGGVGVFGLENQFFQHIRHGCSHNYSHSNILFHYKILEVI